MAVADQELLVRIAADTRSLRRELDRAAGASRQTSERMRRDFDRAGDKLTGLSAVANKAKAAFGGLLAGVTAGALVQSINRITQEMDRLVNTADRLGVTVEALQELRFAAAEVGVEANTLDMALQRFIRRLGEAQAGGGELKDTLSQYGIALRDVNGRTRNADAVLNDLANAIKGAGSEQERLRIAFKAFDSEGAALVTLLKEGGAGLDAFREKARELGVVVKNETARDLAEARREIERFGEVLSTRFTIGVGNAIRDLRRLSAAINGVDLPSGEGDLESRLAGVNQMLQANAATMARVETLRAGDVFDQALLLGMPSRETLIEHRQALFEQRQNIERQLETLRELRKLDAAAAGGGGGSTPAAPFKGSIPKTGQGVNSLTTGKADEETRLFFQIHAKEHNEAMDAAREKAARFKEVVNAQTRAVDRADTALSRYSDSARDTGAAFQSAGVSGLNSFENALLGVVNGTQTAADAFRSMAVSILADMQRILIRKAILGPLADSLDGFFATAPSYAGNPAGVRPGSFNPLTGTAGRAGGGGVRAGTPYMVGENRPEIFVPDTAGKIVASGRPSGGGAAGAGVTNHFAVDMRGASIEAVARLERLVQQVNGSIETRSVAAVVDARRRDPRLFGGAAR